MGKKSLPVETLRIGMIGSRFGRHALWLENLVKVFGHHWVLAALLYK